MPDNGPARPDASRSYPTPLFHFQVTWSDGTRISFQEATGLDADTQAIDYRSSDRTADSTIKRPSVRKPANIVFKRGALARDSALPSWMAPGKANAIERAAITIELVDAKGALRKRWKLKNAFPVKVVGPTLNAKGNDVAIESIEIAHEGLSLSDS